MQIVKYSHMRTVDKIADSTRSVIQHKGIGTMFHVARFDDAHFFGSLLSRALFHSHKDYISRAISLAIFRVCINEPNCQRQNSGCPTWTPEVSSSKNAKRETHGRISDSRGNRSPNQRTLETKPRINIPINGLDVEERIHERIAQKLGGV